MSRHIPTYALYGEESDRDPGFWLHCETIRSRSSRYQWEIRTHRHESFFQILCIEAGSGDATFAMDDHPIRPPAVITVPPGIQHGFRFSRDIDGLVITILSRYLTHSPGEHSRLGEWLARPHLVGLDAQAADDAYVIQTLKRLGDEFDNARAGRNDVLAGYVDLALRLTARISRQDGVKEHVRDENERRLEAFNELLGEHSRAHRPATFYAGALGLSPAHLNRIVRAMTGRTTHEIIAARLVDEARRDLVFTVHSIQEISHRLGFSDPAYFSRFFRHQTGQTPRAWRLSEKSKLENPPPDEPSPAHREPHR